MRILKCLPKTGISFSQATNSNATNGISKKMIFLSSLFFLLSIKSRKILHRSWRTFFGQLKNTVCERRMGWKERRKDLKWKKILVGNFIFILRVKFFCPGMNGLIWTKCQNIWTISSLNLDSTCWQSISFLFSVTSGISLFIICLLVDQMKKVTCISQEVCNVLRSQKWTEIIYLFFIKLLLNRQKHTVGAEYHLGIPALYAV